MDLKKKWWESIIDQQVPPVSLVILPEAGTGSFWLTFSSESPAPHL